MIKIPAGQQALGLKLWRGFVLLSLFTSSAGAADLYTKAPSAPPSDAQLPAVDGINGKAETFGGSLLQKQLYGAGGALSLPVGNQYGVQIDGSVGSFDEKTYAAIAGHAFSRDPSRGLFGLYSSYTYWDKAGGISVSQVGGEAAAYIGRWTVEGIAGVETGNSQTLNLGAFTQTWNIQTRFFDKADISYYLTDNWKVSVGHRYLGGNNSAAFGSEWAFGSGWDKGMASSLFVEARVGENNSNSVWAGLKFYFGQRDKTMIERNRQDDPPIGIPETLYSSVGNKSNSTTPNIPAVGGGSSGGSSGGSGGSGGIS